MSGTMRAVIAVSEEFLVLERAKARVLIREHAAHSLRDLGEPEGPRVWRFGPDGRSRWSFVVLDGPDAVKLGRIIRRHRKAGDPNWMAATFL